MGKGIVMNENNKWIIKQIPFSKQVDVKTPCSCEGWTGRGGVLSIIVNAI